MSAKRTGRTHARAATPAASASNDDGATPSEPQNRPSSPVSTAALTQLEHWAARRNDARLTAVVIGLSDQRVRDSLERRLDDGDVFAGVGVVGDEVRFCFLPRPGTLRLFDASVVAMVNTEAGTVVDVRDGTEAVGALLELPAPTATAPALIGALAPASAQLIDRALAALKGATTTVRVAVSLTGTFYHGDVVVETTNIKLFAGKGADDVPLLAPSVDVALTFAATAPATFDFAISINGVTKKESDTIPGGKTRRTLSYPFATFGLKAGLNA